MNGKYITAQNHFIFTKKIKMKATLTVNGYQRKATLTITGYKRIEHSKDSSNAKKRRNACIRQSDA